MTTDPAVTRRRLFGPIAIWTIVAALLIVAAVSSVGAVNQNVYAAGNFVREYLNALTEPNAQEALALPGVQITDSELSAAGLPADASRVLLRNSMSSDIRNIEIVADVETLPDLHEVTVDYRLTGKQQRSVFLVEKTEPHFGLFQSWRFARSPLAAIDLTVLHESRFDVNGLKLDVRSSNPDQPDPFKAHASYLVFSPGTYDFSHESRLLTGKPVTATVTEPLSTSAVEVVAEANEKFVAAVQGEVDSYLDECSSQEVLFPSECPFGRFIENRLLGLPEWSITEYPGVSLAPTDTNWEMPETDGIAHLAGEVQSLFDGSESELDEDVPFSIALTASIRSDGTLDIRVK